LGAWPVQARDVRRASRQFQRRQNFKLLNLDARAGAMDSDLRDWPVGEVNVACKPLKGLWVALNKKS